jgi:hypothetical protein
VHSSVLLGYLPSSLCINKTKGAIKSNAVWRLLIIKTNQNKTKAQFSANLDLQQKQGQLEKNKEKR